MRLKIDDGQLEYNSARRLDVHIFPCIVELKKVIFAQLKTQPNYTYA